MKRLIVRLAIALCLLPAGLAAGAEAQQIEATLAKAEARYAEALRLEHGWSRTQPYIDTAREALHSGDLERAEAFAERALLTAEQAIVQAQTERDAWRKRILE